MDFHEVRILESLTNQHFSGKKCHGFFLLDEGMEIFGHLEDEDTRIPIPSHPIKSGGVFIFQSTYNTKSKEPLQNAAIFFFSCVIEVIILIVLKREFIVYRVFFPKKHGIFFRDVFLSSHLPISN